MAPHCGHKQPQSGCHFTDTPAQHSGQQLPSLGCYLHPGRKPILVVGTSSESMLERNWTCSSDSFYIYRRVIPCFQRGIHYSFDSLSPLPSAADLCHDVLLCPFQGVVHQSNRLEVEEVAGLVIHFQTKSILIRVSLPEDPFYDKETKSISLSSYKLSHWLPALVMFGYVTCFLAPGQKMVKSSELDGGPLTPPTETEAEGESDDKEVETKGGTCNKMRSKSFIHKITKISKVSERTEWRLRSQRPTPIPILSETASTCSIQQSPQIQSPSGQEAGRGDDRDGIGLRTFCCFQLFRRRRD